MGNYNFFVYTYAFFAEIVNFLRKIKIYKNIRILAEVNGSLSRMKTNEQVVSVSGKHKCSHCYAELGMSCILHIYSFTIIIVVIIIITVSNIGVAIITVTEF